MIDYTVDIYPNTSEMAVSMEIPSNLISAQQKQILLELPSWVPGDYAFEPYGRDVFSVRAKNTAGRSLDVKREGFNAYLVESSSESVIVSYEASCYEPDLGDAMGLIDSDYAVLMGTRYLFLPAYSGPCSVTYNTAKQNWKIHHPSGAKKAGNNKWIYPSFEILLDTPVSFGEFSLYKREIRETPFYFLFVDQAIGFESKVGEFIDQVSLAVEKIHDVFGLFPFSDYTFVLSLNPQADWGLEHLTSNMSGLGPELFVDDNQFSTGIRVCTHELFHAWNVRRLRPAPLGQLSHHLTSGSFTEGLWMAEGFTRYYEFLISTRAKAYTPDQFFSAIAGYYQHLTQQPAYSKVRVTDSSIATYMNHAKYPGRVNNSIDYYDKGMLIAFGLDARFRTKNPGPTVKSLDDAFRLFYLEYFGKGEKIPGDYVGYTTSNVIHFFEDIQKGMGEILDKQLNKPKELDTEDQFNAIGFDIRYENTNYLGLFFMNDEAPVIYGVGDTSPAGHVGIAPQDVIQTINDYSFSLKGLEWVASQSDDVVLEILRGHRKLKFTIKPEPFKKMKTLVWNGTDIQAKEISEWLECDFNPKRGDLFTLDFYNNFHGNESMI